MIISSVALVADGDVSRYAWSHLRRFQNVPFVAKTISQLQALPSKEKSNVKKQAEQIRACLQQAEEYFEAAQAVSLVTRPNLLYYSVMSLALAEILMKQSGESSLDKARAEHRHHGLSLTVGGLRKDASALDAVAGAMRAVPVSRSGVRSGTFELWHRSARELPVRGVVHQGNLTSYRVALTAIDQRLPPSRAGGITLLDCLKFIPGVMDVLPLYGVTISKEARCNSSVVAS
jgi:hypothetical protein